MTSVDRRVRLFHVVENLDRGAVENWLVQMFLASRERYPHYHWTFFCTLGKPGRLDEVVRKHGGEIIHSPHDLNQHKSFFRFLRQTLLEKKPDVLHCHHDIMSAIALWDSVALPIQRRIVHIHNADLALPTSNRLKILALHEPMRRSCLHLADMVVGISKHTLNCFLADRKPKQERDRVLYYGVDTSRFEGAPPDARAFRRELGLDENAKILLFVGRMDWFKNPLFVVEVLECLAHTHPDVVAVFVGVGPLESEITAFATEKSLHDRVRVLGWRNDSDNLMRLCDVFVFPRIEERRDGVGPEGLGLVVVEAQAAGLPVLVSRGVPEDALVVPELCEVVPLVAGPQAWAQAAGKLLDTAPSIRAQGLAGVQNSPFALATGVSNLMALYDGVRPYGTD